MLFQNLSEIAATAPRTSGIRQNGVTHSYPELVERVERLANGLIGLGIEPNDAVAMMMPTSVELFVIAHALFAIGAVAVPLNAQASPKELEWQGRATRIVAIIARPEAMAAAERLKADMDAGTMPLIATGDNGPNAIAQLERTATGFNFKPHDPRQHAFFLFSSGSTGRPKIVPTSHGTKIAGGRHGVFVRGTTPDDRVINSLPSYHAFGFSMAVGGELHAGATTVFWSDPQPIMMSRGRLARAIEEERITMLPGVPFLYDMLGGVSDEVDFSAVRMAYSGAVALKKPTFDRFLERFGIPIRQVFGMSEASLITMNMDENPAASWDSVGRAVDPVVVDILPTPDAPTPEVGEIFVKTPGLIEGYITDDPKANAVFRNGGMLTGDLGRIAEDGNLYITGRSKLIIEVSGLKVDPIEVEDVLMAHPAVAEAVVVGIPDPRTGEQRIKAVVVKKADESAENIIRFSRTRLTPHKVPSVLEFRDQIPRNPNGKILRGQLID